MGDTPPARPPQLPLDPEEPEVTVPPPPSPRSRQAERLSQGGRTRWGRAPPWASGPHPVSCLSSWLGCAGCHPHPHLTLLRVLPSHPVPPTATPLPLSLLSSAFSSASVPLAARPNLPSPPTSLVSPTLFPPPALPRATATPLTSLLLIPIHWSLSLRDHSSGVSAPFPPLPVVPGLPPHPLSAGPSSLSPRPWEAQWGCPGQRVTGGPWEPRMKGHRCTLIQKGGGKAVACLARRKCLRCGLVTPAPRTCRAATTPAPGLGPSKHSRRQPGYLYRGPGVGPVPTTAPALPARHSQPEPAWHQPARGHTADAASTQCRGHWACR